MSGWAQHDAGRMDDDRDQLAAKDAEIAELRAALSERSEAAEQAREVAAEAIAAQGKAEIQRNMLKSLLETMIARFDEAQAAVDQAVALCEYLEGHAKGKMAERLATALSAPFARERAEYIRRLERETVECAQIVGAALMPSEPAGLHIGHLPDMCRDLAAIGVAARVVTDTHRAYTAAGSGPVLRLLEKHVMAVRDLAALFYAPTDSAVGDEGMR